MVKQSSHIFIQPKLTIGAPDDVYEKEADAMADKVMRAPVSSSLNLFGHDNNIQRKCAACEEEDDGQLQKKDMGTRSDNAAPPVVHEVLNSSSGRSLDNTTRSFMEGHFNYDFSNVRLHNDDLAAQSAESINALAYTSGNNIVFNSGQYDPTSYSGKRLLAHELTHVVQQGNNLQTSLIQRGEKWDDFWGVGPWDTYKAKQIADEALSAAEETGLPGIHNGPADAWRHCYWNCRMAKEIGADQAETVSTNHETNGGGPAIESEMDMHNNMVGFAVCPDENCDSCCQEKLDGGKLYVIDESDRKNPKLVRSSLTKRAGSKQKDGGYSY